MEWEADRWIGVACAAMWTLFLLTFGSVKLFCRSGDVVSVLHEETTGPLPSVTCSSSPTFSVQAGSPLDHKQTGTVSVPPVPTTRCWTVYQNFVLPDQPVPSAGSFWAPTLGLLSSGFWTGQRSIMDGFPPPASSAPPLLLLGCFRTTSVLQDHMAPPTAYLDAQCIIFHHNGWNGLILLISDGVKMEAVIKWNWAGVLVPAATVWVPVAFSFNGFKNSDRASDWSMCVLTCFIPVGCRQSRAEHDRLLSVGEAADRLH